MDASQLFSFANALVLPGWALLIFAPKWRVGRDLVAGVLLPLLLGLLYAVLFAMHLGSAPEGASFSSLEGVQAFMAVDWLLLVGWVHYLAFDLFIGAWEVRDARRVGVHHLVVVPCLLLTFMTGPVGLALYLLVRGAWKKRWSVEEVAQTGSVGA